MPISFTHTEDYAVPPARLFRALIDLDHAHAWMAGLVQIQRLEPGPLATGCRWRETRRVFGREATEEFEVVGLVPPTYLALRCDGTKGSSGRGEFMFLYTLEPNGGGTRLHLDGEVRGLGGIGEMIGRLFAGSYRKAVAKDLAALRHHLGEELVPATPG